MIGLLTIRVIWLGLMLTEAQNARYNSRHTARCRIDHPKCANGKYGGRIRCGQRKFAKQRMSVLPEVLLHKAWVPREAATVGHVNTCECKQLQEQKDYTWRNSSESSAKSMH